MKKILIIGLVCLFTSCSLFQKTPDAIVEGQRAAYQGVILAEENDEKILQRYEEDSKAAVTYFHTFLYEKKIIAVRLGQILNDEEKLVRVALLEEERDQKIANDFVSIETRVKEMRAGTMENHRITKKLIESVYNYLSTTPIEIDNVDFWIKKLEEVTRRNTN